MRMQSCANNAHCATDQLLNVWRPEANWQLSAGNTQMTLTMRDRYHPGNNSEDNLKNLTANPIRWKMQKAGHCCTIISTDTK